jgi:arylsulfatase A-like enzyme
MKLLLLVLLLIARPAFATCENCNVILISLDTVSTKPLGAYGAKRSATPNLDAFAKKSRLYTHAYSVAPWTLPAHASMFTGRFPWELKVFLPSDKLPSTYPTLAELLKNAGYQTRAYTGGGYVGAGYGFNRGFDSFTVTSEKAAMSKRFSVAINQTLALIKASKGKPTFLFLHTYDAHEPYLPSAESLKVFSPKPEKTSLQLNEILAIARGEMNLSSALKANLQALYAAGIMDVDRELGRLFAALEQQQLLANTIVIITADHGQEMGEHGSWALHGFQLYNEVMQIPLIVYIPGAPAKNIEAPVSLVDIVPTVLEETKHAGNFLFSGHVLPAVDVDATTSRPVFGFSTGATKEDVAENLESSMKQSASSLSAAQALHAKQAQEIARITQPKRFKHVVWLAKKKFVFDMDSHTQTGFDFVKDPNEQHPQTLSCHEDLCRLQQRFIFSSGAIR